MTTGKRRDTIACAAIAAFSLLAYAFGQVNLPRFRRQLVDDQVGEIWAMTTADINADGKTDIVALSYNPARVFWYENPTWKRRVVVEKHPKMPATICPLDVDGDGKVELIVGAEYYEPLDTSKGGSVWLLRRPDDLDVPWTPIKIDEEPTMHRIHTIEVDGKGKKELVCSALLGREKEGAALYILRRPVDPLRKHWVREVISNELNVIHNTWSTDWDGDGKEEILAAAQEGIVLFQRSEAGRWEKRLIGKGYQDKRGSSEVAVGRLPGGKLYVAAVEPRRHGPEGVVYTSPERPDQIWKRKVLVVKKYGHTVWPADLTGTGVDSLLLGFVDVENSRGSIFYLFHPQDSEGERWDKVVLDTGIYGEDGTCTDLNGDGRLDVVIAGGSTVKIYWNEGQ